MILLTIHFSALRNIILIFQIFESQWFQDTSSKFFKSNRFQKVLRTDIKQKWKKKQHKFYKGPTNVLKGNWFFQVLLGIPENSFPGSVAMPWGKINLWNWPARRIVRSDASSTSSPYNSGIYRWSMAGWQVVFTSSGVWVGNLLATNRPRNREPSAFVSKQSVKENYHIISISIGGAVGSMRYEPPSKVSPFASQQQLGKARSGWGYQFLPLGGTWSGAACLTHQKKKLYYCSGSGFRFSSRQSSGKWLQIVSTIVYSTGRQLHSSGSGAVVEWLNEKSHSPEVLLF